jgi:lipopolysaccharide/colanic/teichoic acid biosynthesis glycosyltransferase
MRIPLPTSRNGRTVRLSFWDLGWALASPILALYLRDAEIVTHTGWAGVELYCLLSAGISIVAFFAFRIQDGMARYFSVHDALDVGKAVLFSELATCIVLFAITRLEGIPRSTPLIHGLMLATGLVAGRMFVRLLHSKDEETLGYHFRRERIILIGANRFSSFFIELLNAYAPDQQRVIAVLDEKAAMIGRAIAGVRILGVPQQLNAIIDEFAVHGVDTERVVIAGESDLLSHDALREVLRVCEDRQVELTYLPRMLGVTEWKVSNVAAASVPASEAPPVRLPSFFWLKRAIDIVGSIVMILLLLPILIAGGLLAILDIGPPVFFWQQRVGRDGRSFLIYKFRTLRSPFDSDGTPIPESGRLSAIGQFLRATRIDELPQLLNVLIGDMSLIGPRPLLPEDQPANAAVRLLVRPGITGWAQVNGGKLVTREQKEKLDEWYIRNASLWVDLRIALLTLKLVFKSTESAEALADAEHVQSKNVVAWRTVAGRRGAGEEITAMHASRRVSESGSPSSRLRAHER